MGQVQLLHCGTGAFGKEAPAYRQDRGLNTAKHLSSMKHAVYRALNSTNLDTGVQNGPKRKQRLCRIQGHTDSRLNVSSSPSQASIWP